jgi:hypothetical protein
MSLAVGAVIGVATGIVAWLLIYRGFAPALRWSDELTKRDRGLAASARWRYAMVLTNGGVRDAVAVTISVRARIRVPLPEGHKPTYQIFEIPTDTPFVPVLRSRHGPPWHRRPGGRYAPVLRLDEIHTRDIRALTIPDQLKIRLSRGEVQLEELLDLGVELRYWAWGSDRATGAFAVKASRWIRQRADLTIEGAPPDSATHAAPSSTQTTTPPSG